MSTITEKHYTVKGEHPSDRIYKDKEYINRLQKHIDKVFDKLARHLDLNEKGTQWLFDYVFNEDHSKDFEEYIDIYNLNYSDLVNEEDIKYPPEGHI
jgi:hypothetical protein